MGKHSIPEEQPEEVDDPGELEYQLRYSDDFPGWQVGIGISFIVFFAILGVWRIVLEFII